MPGYKEYLDVESAVKVLGNILPEDAGDTDAWKQVSEMAQKLDENVGALIAATKGRSQEATAKELKPITEQLARAAQRAADGEADEGGLASTKGAVNALPGLLDKFDQERLQRK